MLVIQIFLNELLTTNITCMQNTLRMCEVMLLQFILSGIGFLANLAGKRFFPRMNTYVLHQFIPSAKFFAAHTTGRLFLCCMNEYVAIESFL